MTDVREEYFREYALVREEACEGKARCLTETQNEILRFLCGTTKPKGIRLGAKMRGVLPQRFTAPYLARMFGCDKEVVRGVFEYLERRHLIARQRPPHRGWEWLYGRAREEAVLGVTLFHLGY